MWRRPMTTLPHAASELMNTSSAITSSFFCTSPLALAPVSAEPVLRRHANHATVSRRHADPLDACRTAGKTDSLARPALRTALLTNLQPI